MNKIAFPQNLTEITNISARHTEDVLGVYRTLKSCEEIQLNAEQMDMGRDIVESVNAHAWGVQGRTVWYLIRYGMMLARNEKAALGAANTQDGTVEQKSEIPSVSTSNDTEN